MQFLQLNNDVILEIFLQFVAIDWDGPFTLMLVCTKWSNLVLSQPRAWTWIMVDETQTEWRERMEVSAHLSKNLPLQIVLRVPFVSQVSLSHITGRCTSLFLHSKYLEDRYFIKGSPSWEKRIISYTEFTRYRADLEQANDSLLKFLKGAPTHDTQIRSEDRHYTSFAYSAWYIYERLNQHTAIQEVIKSGENSIITALVFKHSESAPLPRIQVLITDLWGILPLLSNLSYLELAENYSKVPKDTVLPHIRLRSLLTLKIESPMLGSVFFSPKDDVWLGLLSLLDVLTAPSLEDLSLLGPLHRIIAAMIKCYDRFRFHPLQLNISISVFDQTADGGLLNKSLVWRGIRRCTVDIPELNKYQGDTDSEVMKALRLLFNLIPRCCSFQLHGDGILEPIMQSRLLRDVELHIITPMDNLAGVYKPLRPPRKIKSLSLTGEHLNRRTRVPWISSIEKLSTEDRSTFIRPHGPSLPMRVLKCSPSTLFKQDVGLITHVIGRNTFFKLTNIECDYDFAAWMITNYETPQLRSLTLLDNTGSYPWTSEVFEVVENAGHRLLLLETLSIPRFTRWHNLLPFIANFNRPRGRGIFTVKLSDLPHPAILHHLGRAFRGEAAQPDTIQTLFRYQESHLERHYPSGCYECISSGWSCFGKDQCHRWRSVDMVQITADMPLTEYEGEWGPDGQGLDDDLSKVDESQMDVEDENAEDTSEISVEDLLA